MSFNNSNVTKVSQAIGKSKGTYEDLKAAFSDADEMERFVISRTKFSKIFRKVLDPRSTVLSGPQLQNLMDDFESEQAGQVEYHSFLRQIKKPIRSARSKPKNMSTSTLDWMERVIQRCVDAGKDYRAQFETYDSNFSGLITHGGFRACLEDLGVNLRTHQEEFEEVKDAFTKRGATKVGYLELLNTVSPSAQMLGEEEWQILEDIRQHYRQNYSFQRAGKLKKAFLSLAQTSSSRSHLQRKITSDHFYDCLGDLGFELRRPQANAIFDLMDIAGKGKVTYPEFLTFVKDPYNVDVRKKTLTLLQLERIQPRDLEEMLVSMDIHDAGTATFRDLRKILKDVGCSLSVSDIKRLAIPFDSNENDVVSISKFTDFVEEARDLPRKTTRLETDRIFSELPMGRPQLSLKVPPTRAGWMERDRMESMEEKVCDEFERLAMSPNGKQRLHQVFDEMDRFGQNSLNITDFKRAIKKMGFKFSDTDCRRLFSKLDSDNSGDVDYQEFKRFVQSKRQDDDQPKDAATSVKKRIRQLAQTLDGSLDFFQVFNEFSHDRCGDIPLEACVRGLMKVGLSKYEARGLASYLDKDGDGSISYREFEAFAIYDDEDGFNFDFDAGAKDSGQEAETAFISEAVRQRLVQLAELPDGSLDFFQVFNEFSQDRSGDIPFAACVRGLEKVGLSHREAKRVANYLDKNGDGSISYREFEAFATSGLKQMCKRRLSFKDLESKIQDEINGLAGNEDYFDVFNRFDRDSSGTLSRLEFFDALEEMGFNLDVQELRTVADHIDRNGDGNISYKEFEAFAQRGLGCLTPAKKGGIRWTRKMQCLESKVREEIDMLARMGNGAPDFYEIFCQLDKNGNGEINRQQFLKMLDDLDFNLTHADATDLANRLDTDGDGVISYQEFMSFVNKGKKSNSGRRSSQRTPKSVRHEMVEQKVQDEVRRLAQTADGIPDFYTVFSDIDRDGEGDLDKSEFRYALKIMGMTLNPQDITYLFDKLDYDGNGRISYSEFEAFAMGKKRYGF